MPDIASQILALPGAGQALQFLQAQASAFAYVPTRLQSIQSELQAIRSQAAAAGDAGAVAQVDAVLSGLPQVYRLYASASSKVGAALSAVASGNVGVDIIPQLIGAAGEATLVFKSVQLFDESAQKLASGRLSAAQIAQLRQGGYNTATLGSRVVKAALIVGGVWLGLKLLRGRR